MGGLARPLRMLTVHLPPTRFLPSFRILTVVWSPHPSPSPSRVNRASFSFVLFANFGSSGFVCVLSFPHLLLTIAQGLSCHNDPSAEDRCAEAIVCQACFRAVSEISPCGPCFPSVTARAAAKQLWAHPDSQTDPGGHQNCLSNVPLLSSILNPPR